MRAVILTIPFLVLAACGEKEELSAPSQKNAPETTPERTVPRSDQPDYIVVDHILISFNGGGIRDVTRPLGDARDLANDLLKQVKDGGDWAALKKKYSDDPGPTGDGGGPYGMTNTGAPRRAGVRPRGGMVPAFGDVGFTLEVGEIKMAPYDPQKSPYGFHIIKRIK